MSMQGKAVFDFGVKIDGVGACYLLTSFRAGKRERSD